MWRTPLEGGRTEVPSMASEVALTPMNIVRVGLMAIVAFMIFRTIGNVTGVQAIARNVPS